MAIIVTRRFSWALPERLIEGIHLYLSLLILLTSTASPWLLVLRRLKRGTWKSSLAQQIMMNIGVLVMLI